MVAVRLLLCGRQPARSPNGVADHQGNPSRSANARHPESLIAAGASGSPYALFNLNPEVQMAVGLDQRHAFSGIR